MYIMYIFLRPNGNKYNHKKHNKMINMKIFSLKIILNLFRSSNYMKAGGL